MKAVHIGTLSGKIALVSGASRGAGRAIAKVLGEAGATVIVTGRSSGENRTEDLPGSIEESADLVTQAGGKGVAWRVDHTDEAQIDDLAEKLRSRFGRLDLLVNNVWGGYEHYAGNNAFDQPLWTQSVALWDRMFTAGVRAHLLTNRALAPLLIETARTGKPVCTISTVAWAFEKYMGNVFYDASKAAIIRMAYCLDQELRPHAVGSFAVAPGWMRTERVMAAHERSPLPLEMTESPEYLGRAIAALAADTAAISRSGEVLTAGDLARQYGFTDIDGKQPEAFRIP